MCDDVEAVFNYDVANNEEYYDHRTRKNWARWQTPARHSPLYLEKKITN
jgi:hypothetical protein